ncbi:hypothetical protein NM688_g7842 [Phlebia brevispora]|uniref:Uncharacterized protein n=1 Tax=Phlebia brevispora TaxID=194682 RepID=A0ACC1S0R7_9APHY|nr:hypothetical protein NM688_g7842 [Phlebia brevispora]
MILLVGHSDVDRATDVLKYPSINPVSDGMDMTGADTYNKDPTWSVQEGPLLATPPSTMSSTYTPRVIRDILASLPSAWLVDLLSAFRACQSRRYA